MQGPAVVRMPVDSRHNQKATEIVGSTMLK